jgi:hypothetical protein
VSRSQSPIVFFQQATVSFASGLWHTPAMGAEIHGLTCTKCGLIVRWQHFLPPAVIFPECLRHGEIG